MVKVFFADAGSKQQLLATLDRIEQEAEQRIATLAEFAVSDMPFPRRVHLRALTLTLQYEQERAVRRWTGWARRQVGQWTAADDPGSWDAHAVLQELAAQEAPAE